MNEAWYEYPATSRSPHVTTMSDEEGIPPLTWARHIAQLHSQTPTNSHPAPSLPKDARQTVPEGHLAPPANETTVTELAHIRAAISKLAERIAEQSRELAALCSLLDKVAERQPTLNAPKAAAHLAQSASIAPTMTPIPTQHKPAPHAKARQPPPAWKTRNRPDDNPLHRNSPRRLIIDYLIPRSSQHPGQMLVESINTQIGRITKNSDIRVAGVLYSKKGRPIVIAADGTTAEALIPYSQTILGAIGHWGSKGSGRAWVDHQQFRVKLNGVPTKNALHVPVKPDDILNHITTWGPAKQADLAAPPRWIKPNTRNLTHSTIVIPFKSKEDAKNFLQHRDFLVLGELCHASIYSEQPPPCKPSRAHTPCATIDHHTKPACETKLAPSTDPAQLGTQLEMQTSDMQE